MFKSLFIEYKTAVFGTLMLQGGYMYISIE